jgi:hypothetical protein
VLPDGKANMEPLSSVKTNPRPHRDHTSTRFRGMYGEGAHVAMRVSAWLSAYFVLPLEALALTDSALRSRFRLLSTPSFYPSLPDRPSAELVRVGRLLRPADEVEDEDDEQDDHEDSNQPITCSGDSERQVCLLRRLQNQFHPSDL